MCDFFYSSSVRVCTISTMESSEATTIVSEAQSAGMSITAIAERVGCTRTTIYHWRDHDVKLGRALARALVELRAQVRRKK